MLTALLALQCAAQAGAPLGAGCADDVPRDRRAEYAAAIARGDERHRAFASEQAIDAYHEALLLDPAGFEALRGLADAWNDLGETTTDDAAEDAFFRALGHAQCLEELFPTMPDGPYWKAVAYGNLTTRRGPGDKVALSREIAAAARCALDKDPEFAPALVALGIYERELAGLGFFARMAARTLFGGVEDTSLGESERLLRRAVGLAPQSLLGTIRTGPDLARGQQEGCRRGRAPPQPGAPAQRALGCPPPARCRRPAGTGQAVKPRLKWT